MGSAGMRSARNVSKSVPTISAASAGFSLPHRAPSASVRCLSLSVSAVQSRSAPPSAPPMRSQASRQRVRRPQRSGSEALDLRGGRGWHRDEPAEAKLMEEFVRDDPAPTEAPVIDEASSAATLTKSAIWLRALSRPWASEPPLRAGSPRWESAVTGTRAPALRPRDGWAPCWAAGGPLGRRGPAAE